MKDTISASCSIAPDSLRSESIGLFPGLVSTVLESFKKESERHGYDITFINHNVGGKPTSYLQHCRYRGVDGVVIACVDFLDPLVRELAESELPLVTLDHVFNNRLAVMSDNVQGVEALVHYAYRMGHRRIAFLHGETTTVRPSITSAGI